LVAIEHADGPQRKKTKWNKVLDFFGKQV
jgi:hypothetical protein